MNKCVKCGAVNPPQRKFCTQCGSPTAIATPAPHVTDTIVRSGIETNPAKACGIVFVAAAIISYIGWIPLAMPAIFLNYFVPKGYCADLTVQSAEMYTCSMKVAVQSLIAPVLVLVIMWVARKSIMAFARQAMQKIPPEYQFAGPPLIASTCFTMAWAGVHWATSDLMGIVPHKAFPAIIALYTYGVGRFGPDFQNRFAGAFDFRDKFPQWMRMGALIAAPLLVSLLITAEYRVSQNALKEQIVVILSMCAGYIVLAPRKQPE